MNRSIILIFICAAVSAHDESIDALFPLPNYKKVIDTGMRIYSDLLILEEKAQRHERADDMVDIIVGRLVRIQSYIKQLVTEYRTTKTICIDELEYLSRLIEYMEITAEPLVNEKFPTLFNVWLARLKNELRSVLAEKA